MNDIVRTYPSFKDEKLNKARAKKVNDLIITEDGRTVAQVLKENSDLKADYLKLKDEHYKQASENLQLFNKIINNQEVLIKKVSKLENQVTTLLSNQK